MLRPEVHERHHARIAELVDKARRAQDKKRAGGQAAAILRGHLGSGHGVRSLSGPPKSLAELHAIHTRLHQRDSS